MRKVIVLSGHGNYATGMQSALEFLAGSNEDMFYVNFLETDTEVTLREKYAAIIEKNPYTEFLFVCDLLGGTPFKVAAEITNDTENMELVAGCNVSGILEMVLTKDGFTLSQLAEQMIEVSKNSTLKSNKIDVNSASPTEDIDEGGI